MTEEYKKYEIPEKNELVASFTIDFQAEEHIKYAENNKKYIEEMLIRSIADELSKKLTWYKYKKSKTTGIIYDGYYNYIPHDDPICDTVYEARFDLFSKSLKRINELEQRVAEQNDIISNLNRKILNGIK